MTGIKIRIERDGRPVTLDLDELTDRELDEFSATTAAHDDGWRWVRVLVRWIRDNVNQIPQ